MNYRLSYTPPMLTIATITPEQGEQYYQQENYYSKTAALENSSWWGKGAAALGLRGQISDNSAHKNLVHGFSPDGSQPLRDKPRNKETTERAGVDLTFSAPKSVSLACLVGGDSRLESAHRRAVKRTLEIIERRYAETRVKGERISTDNLTVAMWHHDTSREYDPHLHTHCVVMNATQLPNGLWQSRTDENLYYNKILLGRIYRNELALECRQLGYDLVAHPKELFEIKGYTREQIEAFSKRHEQILDKLAEIGTEATTENKVWAWRQTRVKKNHSIDRQEMLPYWHEEADLYGVTHPVPSQVPQVLSAKEVEASVQRAVAAGIEHCSERQVAFKTEDIEKFITAEIRPFGMSELQQAISSHPDLIQTFDNRFTTQSALDRELATIRLMQQGRNQVEEIAKKEVVESYLSSNPLTQGQREAVLVAATTLDQFIAWQGVAGAGKTYALKELQLMARSYKIKGFAPSAEAAKVLGSELGIEATTVARQLLTKQPDQPQSNQIWIVDEAGLLSAKDAYALLQRATDEQARMILVGDTRQLSAVEAGNPFASLQQAGIKTAYLNESVRQRFGSPDLQKAVKLAAAGQMAQAINHLEQVGRIEQIPDAGERAARIAEQYIKLDPQERQETLILAGTNAERLAITRAIRERLKSEGSLGYGVEATKLQAKDLTQVQSRYTHYYAVGDVVMPTREYRRDSLHKFQPYVVEAVNRDSLTLSDLSGNTLTVDPMKFRKTVYTRETLEIAVGDRLKWTKNDASLGRRNGQEFTVTGIESSTATIEYKDGKTDRINLYQPLHLDHALVSTTYSSQGKTASQVLISAAADRTLSQESFNVAISRAKLDLQIYAEDTEKLLSLAQSSAAKENPLELLRQLVRRRGATEQVVRTSQPKERTVATPAEPPNFERELQSTTPSIETQSPGVVIPPVKRADKTHDPVEISNQPASQHPTEREAEKPTDMAAIFKAAALKLPSPPDWLAVGKRVHCTDTGWGEVTAIIGARLVVKLDSGELAQMTQWPAAVESLLVSATPDTVQKPHVLELSLDADPAGEKLARQEMAQLQRTESARVLPATEQLTDSELLLAEKAVLDYEAAQPPQPPSLDEQQAIKHEIDRLVNQINRLWEKQQEQVKLASSMQRNPFHLWSLKSDVLVKQLEKTMEAISQSIAQKDQKSSLQLQWSKQSQAYQEWETCPQTQKMRQLAFDLKLPQVLCRLEALRGSRLHQDALPFLESDCQRQQRFPAMNPKELWSHYSQGLDEFQLQSVVEVATCRALRDGQPHETILQMLEHSRQYKSCYGQYGPEPAHKLANLILSASIRNNQQQAKVVSQTVSSLLNSVGLGERQADGSLLFEGKSFDYRQYQRTISLIARDGRGEILKVKDCEVVVDKLTGLDLKKCYEIQQLLNRDMQKRFGQELSQQSPSQKQSRGLGR